MNKSVFLIIITLSCSLTAFSQETDKDSRINLNSGVFTGIVTAYPSLTINLIDATYFACGFTLDKNTSSLNMPFIKCGIDFATYNFRPKNDENMFSIGLGFCQDLYFTDDYVGFEDGILGMSPFPKDIKRNLKSEVVSWKLGVPLSYSRDLSGGKWRLTVSAMPSIAALACENFIDNEHKYFTLLDEAHLDFDFRARISYKWLGLFVNYSPNMILNKTSTMDFDTVSFGVMVHF